MQLRKKGETSKCESRNKRREAEGKIVAKGSEEVEEKKGGGEKSQRQVRTGERVQKKKSHEGGVRIASRRRAMYGGGPNRGKKRRGSRDFQEKSRPKGRWVREERGTSRA